MQLQNKMQSLNTYNATTPRVRRKKSNFNITEDREEIQDRRLPGDDLYLPPDVN